MINSIMPADEYSSRVLGLNPMLTNFNGFKAQETSSSLASNEEFINIRYER